LKPGWAERWLLDPQTISPGTAMPSNLFRKQGEHWVFSGPTPPSFQGYEKDQHALLVRYLFQLTPEEQRRVAAGMGRASAASSQFGLARTAQARRGRRKVDVTGHGGSR